MLAQSGKLRIEVLVAQSQSLNGLDNTDGLHFPASAFLLFACLLRCLLLLLSVPAASDLVRVRRRGGALGLLGWAWMEERVSM
jgi:hypothetical protein